VGTAPAVILLEPVQSSLCKAHKTDRISNQQSRILMPRPLPQSEVADLHKQLDHVHERLSICESVMLIIRLPTVNVIYLSVSKCQFLKTVCRRASTVYRERREASGGSRLPSCVVVRGNKSHPGRSVHAGEWVYPSDENGGDSEPKDNPLRVKNRHCSSLQTRHWRRGVVLSIGSQERS